MIDDIKQRMTDLLKAMSQGAYEREEAISLALLAAMAGESIFLLGLPGVGKSMIARRLKLAFKEASSFEYLMSRFSTPDEIFGPVSITKLKDEDTYERVVDGYLPTADIVFLDEIWKAGPAIQNSLLTALNERIFRNGNHDIHLPLKTIISASNELPAEGEGLEALWDRFLIRYIVEPISQRHIFLRLLTEKEEPCSVGEYLPFSDEEFQMIRREASKIEVSQTVCDIICDIRDILSNHITATEKMAACSNTPYVSDRRWRKIMGILRMSALLNGRSGIDPSDCLLLEHLLWDSDDQLTSVRRLVADVIVDRIASHIPQSITSYDIETMPITQPVGDLLSPDGKHYVFSAGGEDVLISKQDYESLSNEVSYGEMSIDNVLRITPDRGEFTVKKGKPGSIVLNTFTYLLKRDTPLRTGNTETLLKAINANMDKAVNGMHFLIENNIFLRSIDSYSEMETAFDQLTMKKSHLRQRK